MLSDVNPANHLVPEKQEPIILFSDPLPPSHPLSPSPPHRFFDVIGKKKKLCQTSHFTKYNWNSPHKNRACHGWSRCNGICLVSGPGKQNKSRTYVCSHTVIGSVFMLVIQIVFGTEHLLIFQQFTISVFNN